ncbi:MAG: zinc ribbon domain-containing protein [Candidatus Gastranaerophilales bacterium]|nr:zinc ribbon domain-containing protein [Candidatus Gastranaerophilales bacterium]
MNKNLTGVITVLVLLLILAAILYGVYRYIRKVINGKVRQFSRALFGTSDLIQGMRDREREVAETPKSVTSATNLYLPSIMKDFPEFHYDEMKSRAENVLTSFLRSVDMQNPSLLTEGTGELQDKLSMRIEMLKREGQKEHFSNIKIHRTEIGQYRKAKGRCSVVLQSAVEYFHYLEKDGQLIKGKREFKEQTRYNVELIYIQDRDTVENLGDAGLALNCPNCGAPLPGLGAKKCAYCDTPVMEFNIRTWNFGNVSEA